MKLFLIMAGWCSMGTGVCNAIMLYRSIKRQRQHKKQDYISLAERGFYGPEVADRVRKQNRR